MGFNPRILIFYRGFAPVKYQNSGVFPPKLSSYQIFSKDIARHIMLPGRFFSDSLLTTGLLFFIMNLREQVQLL
jgi:hypothetical protein